MPDYLEHPPIPGYCALLKRKLDSFLWRNCTQICHSSFQMEGCQQPVPPSKRPPTLVSGLQHPAEHLTVTSGFKPAGVSSGQPKDNILLGSMLHHCPNTWPLPVHGKSDMGEGDAVIQAHFVLCLLSWSSSLLYCVYQHDLGLGLELWRYL